MITLKYLVLGLTYLGFGLGYLRGLRTNRAPIAIVGLAFVMVVGILNLKTVWGVRTYALVIMCPLRKSYGLFYT